MESLIVAPKLWPGEAPRLPVKESERVEKRHDLHLYLLERSFEPACSSQQEAMPPAAAAPPPPPLRLGDLTGSRMTSKPVG